MLLSYKWMDGWMGWGWKSLCWATLRASLRDANMGLFINDVINFGGYRNPPLPLVIICHFLASQYALEVMLFTDSLTELTLVLT